MSYTQSIRFKLMMLVVIPLFTIAFVFIGTSLYTSAKQLDDNDIRMSESTEQTILLIVEEWRASTLGYAKMIADRPAPEMVDAIRQGDVDAIIAQAKDAFTYSGCDGMTFTDMEGNALARVTNPAKFGDNIKTSLAIADAMEGKSVSYAYPTANNGFSFTAGVPIVADGEQIGVLFLSKRLDNDATLQEIKRMIGCDVVLYQHDQPLMSSYSGEVPELMQPLDQAAWSKLRSGSGFSNPGKLGSEETIERYVPIFGRGGDIVGAFRTISTQESNMGTIIMWAIIFFAALVIFFPILSLNIKRLVTPIRVLATQAEKLAAGDMSIEIVKNRRDELGLLQGSMHEMTEAMRLQSTVIEQIAHGDFTATYTPRSEHDLVGNSLVDMIDSNNTTFVNIHNSAEQVAAAAGQVAQGAQNLASGSTEQAATVDEFSSLLIDVQAVTNQNTELAQKAKHDTDQAGALMERSMESMNKLTDSMNAIDDSSQSITKVIKVIDDIAFQTNILALNAAVEAARAGQHGKGFAVVAEEVRSLASKSAGAAAETARLIEGSSQRVHEGKEITRQTSEGLRAVAEIAEQNGESIRQIAELSDRQKSAIDEINTGMEQLSNVIQATAATSEESAASAQEMSSQSSILREIVSHFKLRDGSALPPSRSEYYGGNDGLPDKGSMGKY